MSLSDLYLGVVGVLLFCGFIEQAFLPQVAARVTNWGHAPGWQREIAFWNVGMLVVIGGVLWTQDEAAARTTTAAIVTLTGFLGTNHLLAFRSDRHGWAHRPGAIMNYAGVIAGAAVLSLGR